MPNIINTVQVTYNFDYDTTTLTGTLYDQQILKLQKNVKLKILKSYQNACDKKNARLAISISNNTTSSKNFIIKLSPSSHFHSVTYISDGRKIKYCGEDISLFINANSSTTFYFDLLSSSKSSISSGSVNLAIKDLSTNNLYNKLIFL